MLYISLGIPKQNNSDGSMTISRCGKVYDLDAADAAIWNAGSRAPKECSDAELKSLREIGLVQTDDAADYVLSVYRMLSRCFFELTAHPSVLSHRMEKKIYHWLESAGFGLSLAELCYLMTHKIRPRKKLLGKKNSQNLVAAIYTTENIEDGVLEADMESARIMPSVVGAMLRLIKNGCIAPF